MIQNRETGIRSLIFPPVSHKNNNNNICIIINSEVINVTARGPARNSHVCLKQTNIRNEFRSMSNVYVQNL